MPRTIQEANDNEESVNKRALENGSIEKTSSTFDAEDTQADVESSLFNYGMDFQPETIVRAQGSYIYTSSGFRMLDWTSGQMSCILGHGNPEIVRTIAEHAACLDHLYSSMLSPPVIELGRHLASLLPHGLDKAFFLSTGSESNEAAIRIAKLFTNKFEIVGLSASWHGMTGASMGAQYHFGRSGYGPMMPGNLMLPYPDAFRSVFRHVDGSHNWRAELDYGFNLIDRASCGSLAAIILEPVLSSGGMHVLPKGYLRAVKEHCEARGMLLILDEAQTGVGRTGAMFAFEHEENGVVPDILTLSKTLGNGFPLSAVVTSNQIAQICQQRGFFFCTTHVNDPLAASVGLRVMEIVGRDSLAARARVLGSRLQAALRKLQSQHQCIGDIRGRGLLVGVEIVDIRTKMPAPELGNALAKRMKSMGLWAQFSASASTFRVAPPLTTSDDELETGLRIMGDAFGCL